MRDRVGALLPEYAAGPNYAQSADADAARRVFEHLSAKGLIDGNRRYGEAHPGLYEVVSTLER